jgi:hypothetical protein
MAEHWRTARKVVGETNLPGLHISAGGTRAESNIISLASRLPPGTARLNSEAKEPQSFIHPFEFGSYCLLFGVLLLPSLFVCAAVFVYAAFIA